MIDGCLVRNCAFGSKGNSLNDKLAVNGGMPVRREMLPYGRQWIDDTDIGALVEVLRSDWLTTGPKVSEFEQTFAVALGAREAVAVSNGTAALHTAMYAIGIGPGDEVIVPSITFAATANCVVYQGGTPIFADVDPDTLLLDTTQVEEKITPKTKAIIAVDYAGHPCDYESLRTITDQYGLILVDDACHALGGSYKNKPVGILADLNTFSFHPVKHITTGEGGMITTDDPKLARRMRIFRNHGIVTSNQQRLQRGSEFYEMVDLGYNYRLTDLQCALGISQLTKLSEWVRRRQEIAQQYDLNLADVTAVNPLLVRNNVCHAYHLYVVRIDTGQLNATRDQIFTALCAEGIGVRVHYIPVHLHPFYRQRFGTAPGMCPVAEAAYEQIITLPNFPQMNNHDLNDVIIAVGKVVESFQKA